MHRRGFPAEAIEALGYSAIWHGQRSWNGVALLSRVGEPVETRRALPGRSEPGAEPLHRGGDLRDPRRQHVRAQRQSVARAEVRLQARVARTRCSDHAQDLLDSGVPALLIGDFNVIPTDQDVYKPERWAKDALFAPEAREKYRELVAQGWTDAIRHLHPDERIYTFWHYWRNSFERDAGIRIDHALLSPSSRQETEGGRRRPHAARLGKDQRPRADVGRGGSLNCNCWPKEQFDV